MKVLVVGAGVMGLATAWALTRAGVDVEVVEQHAVPNPLGSSVDQHRLIRYPYGASLGYTRMVRDAYESWARLWADLGTVHYAQTGTLAFDSEGTFAADSAAILGREGIPFEELDRARIAAAYPMLEPPRFALYSPTGGALFAGAIVADLARYLRARGVAIRENARVRAIDPARGEIGLADGARVSADAVVVTAGPWLTDLLPDMAPRVTPSRQVVVYLDPPADWAAAWASHPMLLDIDPSAGFYLVPPRAGTGLKIADHSFSLTGHPEMDRTAGGDEAARIVALGRTRLRRFGDYRVASAKTCFYDVAAGERFLVERRGRAWIATGFSGHGFKFASVIGARVAAAVRADDNGAKLAAWAAGEA